KEEPKKEEPKKEEPKKEETAEPTKESTEPKEGQTEPKEGEQTEPIKEEEEKKEIEPYPEYEPLPLSITCCPPNEKEKITIPISDIAIKTVSVNHQVINELYRSNLRYTQPRPVKIINRFVKPRTPWTYPISIWAYYDYDYEGDSEDYINKCFEFDFERACIYKDIKDSDKLEEVKKYLRTKYVDVINCYKNYSSRANTDLYQITLNLYTEFINNCPGLVEEDKNYNANFINLKRQGAYSNAIDQEEKKKGNKNLPDNLVRHQFLGFLVKVAIDKYIVKFQTMTDPLEAIKFSFENHYDPAIRGFEYHNWRKNRYYNERVDNYLKAYLPILDAVYKSWASRKTPSAKDVWMDKGEFDT
ncbi:MAG: hypothetical protein MJ252_20960, partial [archaeon]|nr:hypothetical protein [archaeon]